MIHKEGYVIILITIVSLAILNLAVYNYLPILFSIFLFLSLVFFGLIVQFFRNPTRDIPVMDNNKIYAPADGKVVVIEETVENEYFKDKRLQVSIFMSPLNVHVNRNPVSGTISYFKYHAGKYLVAWHPKSSTENERTTVVFHNGKKEILLRQIAGSLAKRIICYVNTGDKVKQGEDFGFIKFGSRVDIYLPLDAKINVEIDQKVFGNQTLIATI
jgi:phosphatidylserine decarboxylase